MSGKRLLVVDDEPRFCDLVRDVAERLDYEVRTTSGGREFMEQCDLFKPHMAVIDMVMPDIEGVEIIRWLAKRGEQMNLLIVTGYSPDYATLASKLSEAGGMGPVTTLTKPIKIAALREALLKIGEDAPPAES